MTDLGPSPADAAHADEDARFMGFALAEAEAAGAAGEVPVGCVVVRDGEVVGAGRNRREERADPTAHAEIEALRAAAAALGGWHLRDATAYCTMEPCAMCSGALLQARVARVVFGAADPKAGAAGSVLDVLGNRRLPFRVALRGGVRADEAVALLRRFFAARR